MSSADTWDVADKVVLVTGATSGIGLEAARELARRGARVVMAGRDAERIEEARGRVVGRATEARVDTVLADLASQAQVREMASEVLDRYPEIHLLINNAALVTNRRTLTEDGVETTFAVNHLAPYLLTRLLLDRLRESAPARVVTVASEAHRGHTLAVDDLTGDRSFSGWTAYGRSKLANVLFTRELARRTAGSGVTATCLHPGVVATGLARGAPLSIRLFFRLFSAFLLGPSRGARTTVHLAASPEVAGSSGTYWVRCEPVEPSAAARDDELARRLWRESARLTGLDGG